MEAIVSSTFLHTFTPFHRNQWSTWAHILLKYINIIKNKINSIFKMSKSHTVLCPRKRQEPSQSG